MSSWDDDGGFPGTFYDGNAFSDVGKSSTLVSQPCQIQLIGGRRSVSCIKAAEISLIPSYGLAGLPFPPELHGIAAFSNLMFGCELYSARSHPRSNVSVGEFRQLKQGASMAVNLHRSDQERYKGTYCLAKGEHRSVPLSFGNLRAILR